MATPIRRQRIEALGGGPRGDAAVREVTVSVDEGLREGTT
jgi:hypothetical protein